MYRQLPSVDSLVAQATSDLPHAEVVAIARTVLAEARAALQPGEPVPTVADLAAAVNSRSQALLAPQLQPVINATGVVLHTNLGRAPLSQAALAAMATVGASYSNLEYDLLAGERGGRYRHVGSLLTHLTGADDALVVNNNAAAVLLVLSALCSGRAVLVSRGQAVEIGGGFRIPDVLRQSGARLVEVGTTNRTYAHDYATAATADTAAILTVHRSNFQITGFVHEPTAAELRAVAQAHKLHWIDDWGSGSLLQPADYGLPYEATVPERVAAGCDVICFSGDKLLGGPQAGLIVGSTAVLATLRRHPLLRALRVDKLTLAALEATLLSYLRRQATAELPVWQMISLPAAAVRARATALVASLAEAGITATVVPTASTVGGGALPTETLPSWAIAFGPGGADGLAARLRQGAVPVVGRIVDDRLVLDLRTVLPAQEAALRTALLAACTVVASS